MFSSFDKRILSTFSKSCRASILQMVANAKSGHPGGSLSTIDFLTVLYTQIIGEKGGKVIISNGHISPAVYATLSEMGYVNKEDVINNFRKFGSVFEGHVTRHVKGIDIGTGPLGAGISMGVGVALSEKLKNKENTENVFVTVGDGEMQEGQVYESLLFASKEKLNNLIVFVDYNQVQLSGSLEEVFPINIKAIGEACNWNILEINGHDFDEIKNSLEASTSEKEKPTLIIGKTIMGKGVSFMEKDGENLKSSWHGKAPSLDQVKNSLENELLIFEEENNLLNSFRENNIKWYPKNPDFKENLSKIDINLGENIEYKKDELTDCRTAYGKALLDLAKNNNKILALTADLQGSVMTKFVASELPKQHIEVGIAEQNLVSVSGGLSLQNYIPFCSTFGAFLSSRAKDQARLNDINETNVKMVATHCGLSVGEDGPTHQSIDDMGSFLGMFNTHVCEPADPNHCDRIIRYVASHYGNFYVRMGRHKLPILTKENGKIFFDKDYEYVYGKCDKLRTGSKLTIVVTGALAIESLKAYNGFNEKDKIEIIIVSSIKSYDNTLVESIKKTKNVIVCEDHNPLSGLTSMVQRLCIENNISLDFFKTHSPQKYQLSGTQKDLYKNEKLDSNSILESIKTVLN
jgi:transketolase